MANAIERLGSALGNVLALLEGKVNAEALQSIQVELDAIKADELADDTRDAANLAGDTALGERVAALENAGAVPVADLVTRVEAIESILELTPAGATAAVGAGIGASTEQALGQAQPAVPADDSQTQV